uniref:(northern house mosquito) hypothetical protein n=1 Tax=Culex pipiens TaxID=7175 RepID=A0A8D8BS92_CULPI
MPPAHSSRSRPPCWPESQQRPAISMTSSSAAQPKKSTIATSKPFCNVFKTTASQFVSRSARLGRLRSATWGTSSTAAGCDQTLRRSRPLSTCRLLLTCLVFDPSWAQ